MKDLKLIMGDDGQPWMPTNPTAQTYGSGPITPDPRGVAAPTGDTRGSVDQLGTVVARETQRVLKQAESKVKKIFRR